MRRYERYKDSGVAWLGEIPEHWEEKFLEQVCREKCEKNIGNKESNVLSLSYGHIIRKRDIYGGLVTKDFADYQIVRDGDIILRFTDLQNDHKSLRTGLVTETGIITAAYVCIRPTINSAYLHYLLHAYDVRKVFYGMGAGVRQSISYKDVRHMLVPVPPLSEQEQIVKFLDDKVSRIERLISIRQRQIVELSDLKKAIISRAVTKGLKPEARMKDSGVAWLGEIPEHWNLIKFKHIHQGSNVGEMIGKNFWGDCETDRLFYTAQALPIRTNYIDFPSWKYTQKNDLLLARNATPYVYLPEEGAMYTDHIIRVTILDKYDRRFIRYCLQQSILTEKAEGVSIPTWSVPIWDRQILPVPPLHEQNKIASYLDRKCSQIDQAITNTQQQISELADLKARLISDAVTGKIDTR